MIIEKDGIEVSTITVANDVTEDYTVKLSVYNDGTTDLKNIVINAEGQFCYNIFNEDISEEDPLVFDVTDSQFLNGAGWIELNYENIESDRARIRDVQNNMNGIKRVSIPNSGLSGWIEHVIPGLKFKLKRFPSSDDDIIDVGGCISPSYNLITFAHDNSGVPGDFLETITIPEIEIVDEYYFWLKIPAYNSYISSKLNPHKFKITVTERHGDSESVDVIFNAMSGFNCYCSGIIVTGITNVPWNTED